MDTLISKSPEETLAIGEQWGREAQQGWVIGLTGDLGAGKTQLVKGIAHGLGSEVRVHSPTFALLHEYSGGRLAVFHLDLYRLNNRNEVIDAGLEEYLINPIGVTIVEWVERWMPESARMSLGAQNKSWGSHGITRFACIETLSETERRITYDDSSA